MNMVRWSAVDSTRIDERFCVEQEETIVSNIVQFLFPFIFFLFFFLLFFFYIYIPDHKIKGSVPSTMETGVISRLN